MSHPEFEVSRRHLFVNSNNRSRSPFNISDDGKIRLDLDALGETAEAHDGQFLRLSLLQFSSSNVFDRHLSPANQFFLYVGSEITPAATFTNRTLLPEGVLANSLLLSARYENYAQVTLDIANATVQNLALIYPAADYDYSVTRLGGGGPTYAIEGATQATALGTLGAGTNSCPLSFAPPFSVTLDQLGEYRQSGEKMLSCAIRIQKKSGSFPVIFDNSTDALSLGFIFSNGNNCYLTCGATSTPITNDMSYLATAARMSSGLGTAPDSNNPLALGALNGSYTFSTTTSANDTLTILFSSRCPMQLDPSPMVYMRVNTTGNSYSTANMASDTAQDPSVIQPSEILASIPAQKDNLFFQADGGDPVFSMDINQRSIHQLELFLTNEYAQTQWRSNAYSLSFYVTNISFKCILRLSVIQRAVVATPENLFVDDTAPARFVSQPTVVQAHNKNTYLENATTRLARRGI
jgi:hypothetical protein